MAGAKFTWHLSHWNFERPWDEEGFKRHTVQVRMCFAPPELTEHIWSAMELRYQDVGNTVIIGLGASEDFEDQPMELDTTKRGITFGFSGHKSAGLITDQEAHSGHKSLVVKGQVWPNIPQVVLEPGVRYRLGAWIKAEAVTEEQKKAHRGQYEAEVRQIEAAFPKKLAKLKERWRKRVAKAEKKGKEPPAEPDWPTGPTIPDYIPPGGYIRGKLYQWSPHDARRHQRWDGTYTTDLAEAGAGWQQVGVEFTAPDWGPFIDLVFHSEASAAVYVDEFTLAPVED